MAMGLSGSTGHLFIRSHSSRATRNWLHCHCKTGLPVQFKSHRSMAAVENVIPRFTDCLDRTRMQYGNFGCHLQRWPTTGPHCVHRSGFSCTALASGSETFSNFSDQTEQVYAVGIMGDLHLEPEQMDLFHTARAQITEALGRAAGAGTPGSRECFETAREFLAGFGLPVSVVTGNHDLEGEEFETDEENLEAWKSAFLQERHYWAKDLGDALLVGLSTVKFRSNAYSVHEVFIDDEQLSWFEQTLEANTHRPIIVFSHAPPAGCGLKVVQSVHVKNRCAWLNHSSDPGAFIRLVERHPNIALWFSGHFHLSHNYADSISVVGRTAFVQTGVIGECNRDGLRQSRILKVAPGGYEVYTIDHDTADLRLDLAHEWASAEPPVPEPLELELLCDPEAGYLCGQEEAQDDWKANKINEDGSPVRWIDVGEDALLAHQNGMIVEYSASLRSAVGVVCLDTAGRQVRMVDEQGNKVSDEGAAAATAVELIDEGSGETERITRNHQGTFFQIFQPNKWRLRKAKQAAVMATAMA
uniref:Calcineurin-like phosphoesterase n=1 Tax=Tetraselmis sp. GSL018 TaxID=582737 RepID=A0A061QWZ0_9CHLO